MSEKNVLFVSKQKLYVTMNYNWEFMTIYTCLDEAVKYSENNPKIKVMVFSKDRDGNYCPDYSYILNGKMNLVP